MRTAGAVWVVSVPLQFYSWSMSFADFKEYKQLFIGLVMPAHMDTTWKGPEGRLRLKVRHGCCRNKPRRGFFYKMTDMAFDDIILV